ncbi:MAG TPA: heterodisulfide reductase-related iron-sulfur binding cluster [Baekduia sp.]|nr:heterodisulfide reductase-related iron-sulfur binding cluster [Baekduia sp.]
MQHRIPVAELGPQAPAMAGAVESCVHCGFCLPTCPTYVTMGEEMDSPRGRIFLMKEVLEGRLEVELAVPYIDNCLGCQACETACPSGVAYGELVTPFRAYAETRRERTPLDRLQRALLLHTLPHPRRFRAAARLGRLARPLARLLPDRLSTMLDLLPAEALPPGRRLPAVVPAEGERRARVALLAGCAQQVLAPDINRATLRVLARNGVETVIPPAQGCCGALALHTGAAEQAKPLARANIKAFGTGVDAVITNAAGCGSGMKEYGLLFAGEPEHAAAQALADRVLDVTSFLASLGLRASPPPLAAPLEVAYHDACHLAHAQGVRRPPRELLSAIDGVSLVEPAEWELCCGSAGTYNVEKPETAHALGRRKAINLLDTGSALVATGNVGCMTQIQTHLRALGREIPVLHTLQVLDRAYALTLREHAKT